jgi:hypothetical protein
MSIKYPVKLITDKQRIYQERALLLHAKQVEDDIKRAGADTYDMLLPETHVLASLIHPTERIIGIVYGRYKQASQAQIGKGALVATTDRVLLIDKKPMFARSEELTYFVISGVSYSRAGFAGTVTLHTRMGDISVRTMNRACAESFIEAVEAMLFRQQAIPTSQTYTP